MKDKVWDSGLAKTCLEHLLVYMCGKLDGRRACRLEQAIECETYLNELSFRNALALAVGMGPAEIDELVKKIYSVYI